MFKEVVLDQSLSKEQRGIRHKNGRGSWLWTGSLIQMPISLIIQGTSPNHVHQYTNIWLYDQPMMLNTAIQHGLTDDQWGMIKERGFFVGPWYLIVPAIAHVKLPYGNTGVGFIFWNGLIALFFVGIFPLVPGLRSLPRYLKLYKLIYAEAFGRFPGIHRCSRRSCDHDALG